MHGISSIAMDEQPLRPNERSSSVVRLNILCQSSTSLLTNRETIVPNFSVFQFAYTTLFGAYCSFLFIRTGSLFPPLVAHSFCNVMGLPQITAEMKQWPRRKYGTYLTIIFRLQFLMGFFYSYSYNSHIYSRDWIIYLHSWPVDLFSRELVLATAHSGKHG